MGAVAEHPLVDVRADFPVLEREFNGRRVAYLDSAATSQRPNQVVEAMDRFQRQSYAPIHRGVYELARESTDAFEGARERIAAFVNWEPACSIFTLNATEAINLVAYSWGRRNVGAGDEVLITEMEHHSNIVPWQILCEEQGARLRYVPVTASRRAGAGRARRDPRRGPGKAPGRHARVQRAGHGQPDRRHRAPRARRRAR